MTRLSLNISFFDPYLTPGDKMKILKPYWASTRHSQWDARMLEYHFSNPQNVNGVPVTNFSFFRTDGRTERGNNNIPELFFRKCGYNETSLTKEIMWEVCYFRCLLRFISDIREILITKSALDDSAHVSYKQRDENLFWNHMKGVGSSTTVLYVVCLR